VKILLLGAGDSGKSTVAKQLKILYLKDFKDEEILMYKKQIHGNVLTNSRVLIRGAEQLGVQLHNEALTQRILSDDYMADGVLTPDTARDIKQLWMLQSIQTVYSHRTDIHLFQSAGYFFSHLDRISQPGYRPNHEDILCSRRLTVGAEEIEFVHDGVQYLVIDVGGQRGEREKWIDYFQNNHAVIFFVAISEYDQKLAEDNVTSRMAESLRLFSDICIHPWFLDSAIILFLNKSDMFREKIQHIPITCAFPDYTGPNEFDAASEYIQGKFLELSQNKRKRIYPFITCATNTENFKSIFASVKDIVISTQASGV